MRKLLVILICLISIIAMGCPNDDSPSEDDNPANSGSQTFELVVSCQPFGAGAGEVLQTQPCIQISSSQGVIDDSDYSTLVTAAIATNSGTAGAQLLGTVSAVAEAGVVHFTDLAIDQSGENYQLEFSAEGFDSVTSLPFSISSGGTGVILPSPLPADSDVTFNIHSQEEVHPISRFIYGINGHDFNTRPANLTLTRSGGNRLTAYNWETNASNAGTDWYNQNDGFLGGGDTPGGAVTPTINNALAHNAGTVVTIPMIGYVSADKNGDGDVGNSPDYIHTRFNISYPAKQGAFQLPPDTSDNAVYQDEWVHFLQQRYPGSVSSAETPIFFSLDNEPDLWSHTHPRLCVDDNGNVTGAVSYEELIQKSIDYAAAIKDVAPGAAIFGPVNYGWQGMVNLQGAADANGRDFLDVYLTAMADAETSYRRRLLDVLDVHWYPEAYGGGTRITEDGSQADLAAARMQAPRSLWDDTYTEDSWIAQWSTNGPIRLLPRLQSKIDAHYPGTKIAVTEYYYGGGAHISGAIAQADVLGIFGREGVFAATLWKLGTTDHRFIYGGFEIFRNYDGNHGAFGDVSVHAENSDIENASVYASLESGSTDRMVIVCINKTDAPKVAGISVTHTQRFNDVLVYSLTGGNSQPQAQGSLPIASTNAFQYTMPAHSVSSLVLRR